MSSCFSEQEVGLQGGIRYLGDGTWLSGTQCTQEQGIYLKPLTKPHCDWQEVIAPIIPPVLPTLQLAHLEVHTLALKNPEINVPNTLLSELLQETHEVEYNTQGQYNRYNLIVPLPTCQGFVCMLHPSGLNGENLAFTVHQLAKVTRRRYVSSEDIWKGLLHITQISVGKAVQSLESSDYSCLVAVVSGTTVYVIRMFFTIMKETETPTVLCTLLYEHHMQSNISWIACDPFGMDRLLLSTENDGNYLLTIENSLLEEALLFSEDIVSVFQILWGVSPNHVYLIESTSVHSFDLSTQVSTLIFSPPEKLLTAEIMPQSGRAHILLVTSLQQILIDTTAPHHMLWVNNHHQPLEEVFFLCPLKIPPLNEHKIAASDTMLVAAVAVTRRQCLLSQYCVRNPHGADNDLLNNLQYYYSPSPPYSINCHPDISLGTRLKPLGLPLEEARRLLEQPPDIYPFMRGARLLPLKLKNKHHVLLLTLSSCGRMFSQVFLVEEGCGYTIPRITIDNSRRSGRRSAVKDYCLENVQTTEEAVVESKFPEAIVEKSLADLLPCTVDLTYEKLGRLYNMRDIVQFVLLPFQENKNPRSKTGLRGETLDQDKDESNEHERHITDFLNSSWETRTLFELNLFMRCINGGKGKDVTMRTMKRIEQTHRDRFYALSVPRPYKLLNEMSAYFTKLAMMDFHSLDHKKSLYTKLPEAKRMYAFCRNYYVRQCSLASCTVAPDTIVTESPTLRASPELSNKTTFRKLQNRTYDHFRKAKPAPLPQPVTDVMDSEAVFFRSSLAFALREQRVSSFQLRLAELWDQPLTEASMALISTNLTKTPRASYNTAQYSQVYPTTVSQHTTLSQQSMFDYADSMLSSKSQSILTQDKHSLADAPGLLQAVPSIAPMSQNSTLQSQSSQPTAKKRRMQGF